MVAIFPKCSSIKSTYSREKKKKKCAISLHYIFHNTISKTILEQLSKNLWV